MQTFLPYPSFTRSAAVLDRQRLGKQRVEAKQILQCLLGEGSLRWRNHPAVKMWAGHEIALAQYGEAICEEWIKRGYRDSLLPFFQSRIGDNMADMPSWLGDVAFHRSHQSNLIRKMPEHYALIFTNGSIPISATLPYIWPIPLLATSPELEYTKCKFCGIEVEDPCDVPPPDICSVALSSRGL